MATANKIPGTRQASLPEFLTPFNSLSPPTPAHPKTQQLKTLFRKGAINYCLLKAELCSEHLTVSSVHQTWHNQHSRSCRPESMIFFFSCSPTQTFLNRSPSSLSDILTQTGPGANCFIQRCWKPHSWQVWDNPVSGKPSPNFLFWFPHQCLSQTSRCYMTGPYRQAPDLKALEETLTLLRQFCFLLVSSTEL